MKTVRALLAVAFYGGAILGVWGVFSKVLGTDLDWVSLCLVGAVFISLVLQMITAALEHVIAALESAS